jgi:general secretion pathway protein G
MRMGSGFTLVELLVVIIILAILIALLLPAINGAFRTARQAAVSAEINLLAQALERFKAQYGDYPPSRFLAVESGNYVQFFGNTTPLNAAGGGVLDPTSPGTGDITLGQLAQRSAAALRRFFPKLSTTGLPAGVWYDFNGNGKGPAQSETAYILHGHECLVFFLGGVPLFDGQSYGLTGFGKDPTNPFSNSIVGNAMYNPNRQQPFFDFNAGRLFLDPNGLSGIPGYYDSLGTAPPPVAGGAPTALNYYAYFSAYGSGAYDPNDVNFWYPAPGSGQPATYEVDANLSGPIGLMYLVGFPTFGTTVPFSAHSPSPNPYTTTTTAPTTGTITYQKPQTYQIISAGVDGLYGVGGQYISSNLSSATVAVPVDTVTQPSPYINTTDPSVRQRESDNLTNFSSGPLR